MNDIVSRMIWKLNEEAFQFRTGLELPRIRLIRRVRGCSEGQRVEDGGFDVVGVSVTDSAHGAFIGQDRER